MSKAVLISIQPQWCELIASGKKTIEVRKTKPKLSTPFKCYIYCTKPKSKNDLGICLEDGKVGLVYKCNYDAAKQYDMQILSGKIIGEFVCDDIVSFGFTPYNHGEYMVSGDKENKRDVLKESCLSFNDMYEYIGEEFGYAWHISDLKIYDKPKELNEFITPSRIGCCNEGKCKGCKWLDRGNGFDIDDDCFSPFDTDEYKPLRRPPQSWCYVERSVDEQ